MSDVPIGEILTKTRIAGFATMIGMREILRWVPKDVRIQLAHVIVILTVFRWFT